MSDVSLRAVDERIDGQRGHVGSSCAPDTAGPGGPIEITEDGVARAFTRKHADSLLYDHDAGRWYEWQGDHWQPETTGRAYNYCRELARDASESLTKSEREKPRRASFASGVERMAQRDPVHAARQSDWDSDPWVLGCPNDTIDLKSGKSRAPRPADRITRQTTVAPSSTQSCPLWLSFLAEATGGDDEMIGFLRRWCGYSLTGTTREHALIFLYGPGGNGKSVFLNTIAGILGDYAATASMQTFTASKHDQHPTDLAMLRGARLVSASETEEGRAWAESRIKNMTGGDPITARFMRKDFFTYQPQFKLTIVGNHKPVLHNVDDAARRRFNIVPFTVKPAQPDHQLEEKLRAEWPGILRWMIDGCLEWQADGLKRPQSVVAATADYFNEQDFIGQWLEDECIVEPDNDHRWETSADLFKAWKDYAQAAGEVPGTQKSLASKLARHGLQRSSKWFEGNPNAEATFAPLPVFDVTADPDAMNSRALGFRLSRRQLKDKGRERMAAELVWSIAQGIGRAIDATLFEALAAQPANLWALGAPAAQGVSFSAIRAIVGTDGHLATADRGQLFADGIEAELTPDTAKTWLGVWSRAAVVIDPDIRIVVTRMDASGALEAFIWISTQALIPNPAMFWSTT